MRARCPDRDGVIDVDELLRIGSVEGAAALGLDVWGEVGADLGHASLAGVAPAEARAALVFGCGADVLAPA